MTAVARQPDAAWRERVLATMLRAVLVLGSPMWVWALYSSFVQGETENGFALSLVFGAWTWAAFGPGPHWLKASVTFGSVLALGLAMVLMIGFTANTAIVLSLAVFLGVLTLDAWAAVFAIAAGTVAYAAAAYATVQYGWIPIQQDHPETMTRATRTVVAFPVFIGGVAVAVRYIINKLESSVASLSDLSDRLATSEFQYRELFN